jgi:hypothetical protein
MHEEHGIERQLRRTAERISAEYGGAPVVVIVGGSVEAHVPRCMVGSTLHQEGDRLRDLLGILQTAIQIETLKHFQGPQETREGADAAAQALAAIRRRFGKAHQRRRIPLLRGGSFWAELTDGGIQVSNLHNEPLLPWAAFEETVRLLEQQGGRATRGSAMEGKLGEECLPLDSVEGHVARTVYGKRSGDSVLRRITPIACILIWAGVCEAAPGELVLRDMGG